MKLIHVDDQLFTDQLWQVYYSLLQTLHKEYGSPFSRIGWEETRNRFRSLVNSHLLYHRFAIFDGEKAIGWADLNVVSHGTENQNAMIRLDSISEDTSREFELIVANELLRLMTDYGSQHAHFMATAPRLSSIAQHWHGKVLNRLDRFQLVRKDANVSLMKQWMEEIPRSNPDLHLKFFSPIPEEYLEIHTRLFADYMREMPTERPMDGQFRMTADEARRNIEWRRKNNVHIYTYAIHDADGNMIGHSNASISGADPSDVYQAMTGINREYRGRGLSRLLKAALFFKIGEDFPDNKTMTTDMRAINAPIQKVNTEMGYTLVSSGHEFELSADGFRKFIGE